MSGKDIHPIKTLARKEKEKLLSQKSGVFWLFGLSGSGKSTLGLDLEDKLAKLGFTSIMLDGDNLRNGLCEDLSFSLKDRMENVRRVSEIAKIISSNGIICIVSLISPTNQIRNLARSIIGEKDFHEIYIKASYKECRKRDVKGLYAKSDGGKLMSFSGKDSVFEEPMNPWLLIDTENDVIHDCMTKLCDAVLGKIR